MEQIMLQTVTNRHYRFHRELRETFMRPFFLIGLLFGIAFLIAGGFSIIETAFFPLDALAITTLSFAALTMQYFGYIAQANNWFLVGLMWAVGFNIPDYGINHPVTALFLPVIIVSGLLIGRIFQTTVVLLCSMFIPLFGYFEYIGLTDAVIAILTGDTEIFVRSVLFWVSLIMTTGILVRIFAANLERTVAAGRGQAIALSHITTLLKDDVDLDQLYAEVIQTTSEQLQANDSTLFLYQTGDETLVATIYYKKGDVIHRDNLADPTPIIQADKLPVWLEARNSKKPFVITDVANDARLRFRARLISQGIRTILIVPLLLDDNVIGMMTLNSPERRSYLPEEIDLAQALVRQITLGMQLSHLTQANRETAIIRERNRMAREMHDTLAQGFTGVIVQLQAAEDVLDTPENATPHLHTAQQLARESLQEARRSVMALRPQSLDNQTLPEAIELLIKRFITASKSRITFEQVGTFHALLPTQAHHLLRITQEALTNAQKYASAEHIRVHIQYDEEHVTLKITDDGRGFDVDDADNGFGLMGMRERADLLNGTLEIKSQIDNGTQITLRIAYD